MSKMMNIDEAFRAGVSFYQKGNMQNAASIFKQITELDPRHAEAHQSLAIILCQTDNIDEGLAHMLKAVENDQTNAAMLNNLGEIYRRKGDLGMAESAFTRAINLDPTIPDSFCNMGIVYKEKEMFDEAVYCYQKAIELNANFVPAYNNLGNIFAMKGDHENAIEVFNKALEIVPNQIETLTSLGLSLYEESKFEEAEKTYRQILKIKPDFPAAKVNLALILFRKKDFRQGLELFEARLDQIENILEFGKETLWTGQNLKEKTLAVYYEREGLSGFGDTIQFCRYFENLRDTGVKKIIFKCQTELKTFLENQLPEFVDLADELNEDDFDYHMPFMSIMQRVKARAKEIPSSGGYLKADPEKVKEYKEKYFDTYKLKVGFFYKTEGAHKQHEKRSIPLEMLAELADENISLYSLQIGADEKELSEHNDVITDVSGDIKDFADTAAMIENLDILITADTAACHVAGAIGKDTLLALRKLYDWRWFTDKETGKSLFYDSVTPIIQKEESSWESVVAEIKTILKQKI